MSVMEWGEDITEIADGIISHTKKTWYGVPVDISVSVDHWHRVVLRGLAFPHFGLVNLFARWGLPKEDRLALTYRHEIGHLQTFPVPLAHLLLLLWSRRGHRKGSRCLRVLVGLVAHQAVWELSAEGYLAFHSRREQNRPYSTHYRLLYAVLWSVTAFLAAAGSAFLIQRNAAS